MASNSTQNVPQKKDDVRTMVAAQGMDYGNIDEMIFVHDTVPYPSFESIPAKKRKDYMIIKTYAVALACGDCRVLSGLTRELQGPPSFPYIPGGDCAGIVVEIPEEAKQDKEDSSSSSYYFKVGDKVAARFVDGPRDALAEYALIHRGVCEKIGTGTTNDDDGDVIISFLDAAALASACPATLLADRIQPGDRVLIMGAGGGVGSHASQLMKQERGAAYIAGVSMTPDRLLQEPLSYDRAIDYTKEDPFALKEFQDNPFDVVLDLAGGSWLRLLQDTKNGVQSIVKPATEGGRYLTTTPDQAIFEAHSMFAGMTLFLWIPLWRAIKSRTFARSSLPKYTFAMSLPSDREVLTRTLDYARSGKLKAVIDPRGPFPFTTEGVREAFRLQESRHIHGKVVIDVAGATTPSK